MNTTERVIREQFGFWETAPLPAPLAPSESDYAIVGCGTSFYLAEVVAAAFNLRGLEAVAVPGAEWARRPRAYRADLSRTRVIGLSRSGESTETVQALAASRREGLHVTAITCADGSTISKEADAVMFLPTHPDEGIVMTASASLMLMAGLRLAGVEVDAAALAREGAAKMAELDRQLPQVLEGRSHFVYLGAGPLFGLAQEGALKLQEMSLSVSQTFHPMEYRHGPVSLVDERTLVVLLYSDDTRDEEARLASELSAKGARVIGLGGPGDLSLPFAAPSSGRPLAMLPALQILGERVAERRGIDTEAPRHLGKVVVLA
jgi:glutamine---fructose-6-phosphate transaminase (isomerizing)